MSKKPLYDDDKAKRWGHRVVRCPVQLPKPAADTAKRVARHRKLTLVGLLTMYIARDARRLGLD